MEALTAYSIIQISFSCLYKYKIAAKIKLLDIA